MRVRLTAVVNLALVAACVLLAAALAPDASAQAPAQQAGARSQSRAQAAPTPRTNEADASADLSITARVTAESLRFEKVPNAHVEFTGKPERVTVWEAERENLPRPVQPGVTYRDIGITLRITSVFADIDRIVAEALGEVPPSDDARPPAPTPEPPAANPPASNTPPASADATARRLRPARRGRGQ